MRIDTSWEGLCPDLRPKAFELFARCAQARIFLVLVETLRDPGRQSELVARGKSKRLDSLHLPQPGCLASHALDAAPLLELVETVRVKAIQWDTKHPAWIFYGETAESLGLVWGGRWRKFRDYGHVEWHNQHKEV